MALLHLSNENAAYLFEIRADISNILKQGPNTCCVASKGVRLISLISYRSRTRSGTPPLFLLRLLDFLMIGNILAKFEKKSMERIFSGE